MSTKEPVREASLGELSGLTLRANVAYAARCARRMQPLVELASDDPHREVKLGALETGIRVAEEYVRGTPLQLEQVIHAEKWASRLADEQQMESNYAAYAASHAARGTVYALRSGERADQDTFMEIVAAAFGASRVIMSNLPHPGPQLASAVLRADLVKLQEMRLGRAKEIGQTFDPSENGPLGPVWPNGMP